MKSKAILVALLCLLCAVAAFGQAREGGQQPPAMDKVTQEIPGVVKAGTSIEIVKFGLGGTDAGMGLSDGSVLVTSRGSLIKIDSNGNSTTIVENTEQAAGLTIDPRGRVIAGAILEEGQRALSERK